MMRGMRAQVRAIARSMKLDEAADKNNAQAIIAAFAPFKDSKVHETKRQTRLAGRQKKRISILHMNAADVESTANGAGWNCAE